MSNLIHQIVTCSARASEVSHWRGFTPASGSDVVFECVRSLLAVLTVINFLAAHELARLIALKQLSVLEVVEAHLQQITRMNPQLNAFTYLRTEEALREARAAQERIMRGDALPPLLGVPVTIKSCIDLAGLRCEAGSRLRTGYLPVQDAPLVARLKRAGAIVIGN